MKSIRRTVLFCVLSLSLQIILTSTSAAMPEWYKDNWLVHPDGTEYVRWDSSDWPYKIQVYNGTFSSELLPGRTVFRYRLNSYDNDPDNWSYLTAVENTYKEDGNTFTKQYVAADLTKPNFGGPSSGKIFILVTDGGDNRYVYDWGTVIVDGQRPNEPSSFTRLIWIDGAYVSHSDEEIWYNKPNVKIQFMEATDPLSNNVSSGIKDYLALWKTSSTVPNETEFTNNEEAINKVVREIQKTFSDSGVHRLFVKTRDNAGNLSLGQMQVIYRFDNTPPTKPVIDPLPAYVGANFNISWTASDAHSDIKNFDVQKKINTGDFITWKTNTEDYSALFDGTVSEGSTISFKVMAKDNAGNESVWSDIKTVTVDLTPPNSAINAPTGTQTTISPTIYWTKSDNLSGTGSFEIQYLDVTSDGTWGMLCTINDGSKTSTRLTTSPFKNGHTYQLRIRARDKAGNWENWPSTYDVSFLMDAGDVVQNLTVDLTHGNPERGEVTPRFTWLAPTSVTSLGYAVSMESEPIIENVDVHAPTTYYESATPLSEGEHFFYVKSKRNDGVWSGAVACGFTVDTGDPSVTLNPFVQTGTIITLTGEASDTLRLSNVEYQILRANDSVYRAKTQIHNLSLSEKVGTFEIDTAVSEDGTYKIKIIATDSVGRVGTAETATFTIDQDGPTLNNFAVGGHRSTPSSTTLTVGSKPLVYCDISDGNGIDMVTLEVINAEDGTIVLTKEFSPGGNTDYTVSFQLTNELPEGVYLVSITAQSTDKESGVATSIQIFSGPVTTVEPPKSYPNPFRPGVKTALNKYVAINFELTVASPVKINIYNIKGSTVKSFALNGIAGVNEVEWDGKDNFGKLVANGPYLYFIIVDGKVIGRGEMAAFK